MRVIVHWENLNVDMHIIITGMKLDLNFTSDQQPELQNVTVVLWSNCKLHFFLSHEVATEVASGLTSN